MQTTLHLLHNTHIPAQLLTELKHAHPSLHLLDTQNTHITLQILEQLTPALKLKLQHHAQLFEVDTIFTKPHFDTTQIKVLAFDMDSTLINIECIDEIAREVGKVEEVSAITEAAMRGEITDFAESLRKRVALLAGTPVTALHEVFQRRLRLNPGADALIIGAKRLGWKTVLVSGGFTFFADQLKQQLQLDQAHSNVLEISGGFLTGNVVGRIVDGQAKKDYVHNACLELGLAPSAALVMGDGSNDLLMMADAGLSIGFRAKPIVKEKADGSFDHVGLDAVIKLFNESL